MRLSWKTPLWLELLLTKWQSKSNKQLSVKIVAAICAALTQHYFFYSGWTVIGTLYSTIAGSLIIFRTFFNGDHATNLFDSICSVNQSSSNPAIQKRSRLCRWDSENPWRLLEEISPQYASGANTNTSPVFLYPQTEAGKPSICSKNETAKKHQIPKNKAWSINLTYICYSWENFTFKQITVKLRDKNWQCYG